MAVEDLTNDHLEYIERSGFVPPPWDGSGPTTHAPPELRASVRIDGVGRFDKRARPPAEEQPLPPTATLLAALHNHDVPVAFEVDAAPGRVAVYLGTWLPSRSETATVEGHRGLLEGALDAVFASVTATRAGTAPTARITTGGLVLGIPTNRAPDRTDGAAPIDRLLRALTGTRWRVIVLAQPVTHDVVRALRLRTVNELRSVQTAAKVGGAPSPLAEQYTQLLKAQLASLSEALGSGAWRTAVYLLGDETTYHGLASLWRGLFQGERSLPEPVRVWARPDVPSLAAAWALVDPHEETNAPGLYSHPFQHQTLLTSAQLAAYVQLPNVETNGFTITQVPDFDTAAPPATEQSLHIGAVVERNRVTDTAFSVDADRLTRHAFVTGITGSGKTNTLFHLLRQAASRGVPFLVVEPAKTEYRVLVDDEALGPKLRVFTLGDETVSPFRLNPFEIPEGIPAATHLDLLRSVFHVSFGMWTPLPQVLEAALHGVYADRGWDITLGVNHRLDDSPDRSPAFPTLGDLVTKVETIVPTLGYEEKVADDILAALRTRLNSLRTGGKGRMLNGRRSLPFATLLDGPTVIELQGMGDDDDKAFVMGLLMIRLAEHRRTEGDVDHLRHLLVVEEAHRLLANPAGPRRDETEADARGKAVETFTNLLSEVRAYGQGVVVVDQVPGKLAPDVVKNTATKVAHQVVAGDDRQVLAAAMAMTEQQSLALATLPVGRAAVFTSGEDAPVLVQVPRSKGGSGTWPSDDRVRQHMAGTAPATGLLPSDDCDERCAAAPEACAMARRLLEDGRVVRAVRRLVFSMVATPGAFARCWPDVVAAVTPELPPWLDPDDVLRCLARHGGIRIADQRGARAEWTFAATVRVGAEIDAAIVGHVDSVADVEERTAALRADFLAGQGGGLGPYEGCAAIWGDDPGPCLCRYPVAELMAEGGFATAWAEARDADRESEDESRPAVRDLCVDAAYHLVEFPAEGAEPELAERLAAVAEATAHCFAQQMLAAEEWAHPTTQRRVLAELMVEPAEGDADG